MDVFPCIDFSIIYGETTNDVDVAFLDYIETLKFAPCEQVILETMKKHFKGEMAG